MATRTSIPSNVTRSACPAVARALIVEDCLSLHHALRAAVDEIADDVHVATTVTDAVRLCRDIRPGLLLLDVALPDGTAIDILDAIEGRLPSPTVVAITGSGDDTAAFELARRGVRAYVSKPVTTQQLRAAIEHALTTAPNLTPHVLAAVGHVPIKDLEQHVRAVMVREALARAGGNVRRAARVLSISRQLLQHILRKDS